MEARTLLIVPTYNEEDSLEGVVNELRRHEPDKDILVVDDCSTDKTPEVARRIGVKLVRLPFNLGIGGAVQTGFKFAKQHGYGSALQVDGDGQHDPDSIGAILRPVLAGLADISIGSRFLLSENSKPPFGRSLGIKFFSWLTSNVLGQPITDCSSGFRGLNRKAFEFFAEEYPVDFPDAEAIIASHKAGFRVCEVPARFRNRKTGKSSLRNWRMLYYPFKETFSILILLTKGANKGR